MILVTPCGIIDTINFGKSKTDKNIINLSLKEQEKKDKKVEAEAKTKENELLNTKKDEFKSNNLVDISA